MLSKIRHNTFLCNFKVSSCSFIVTEFKRATRLMTSDKSLSYTDRLQKFGLTTLETRRLRGDLIEVFKMFKGFGNIKLNDFWPTVRSRPMP